jgi:hypothetical protein
MNVRKISLWAGSAFIALLALLLILPWFFRGPLERRLKAAANESVNARVNWTGVSVGLLGSFPNLSLAVSNPTVVGVDRFDNDTLLTLRSARLVLDIGTVVSSFTRGAQVVVRELALDHPDIRLRVLGDGTANWNITRPASASGGAGRSVGVTLRNLSIDTGRLTLDDAQSRMSVALAGLEESLDGDFAREQFVLRTRTRIDTATLHFAGIPYLSRAAIEINADVNANLRDNRFTFANDTVRLNNLLLAFSGAVTTGKPDIGLDVSFSAPSTAFRDILSLVPVVYAHEFKDVQTTGTMSVSGKVRGQYGARAFPAFNVDARVENGTFKYPSLPLPARDIFLNVSIRNPGGHVDSTVVDVERLHAEIGGRPLEARLVMRTPVKDPDVDLRVQGSVNLADLAKTVKLEGVNELTGIIAADLSTRARLSDVDAKRYDRVDAKGTLNVAKLTLRSASIPHPIAIDTAAIRMTPRNAELSAFAAKIGASDLRATGTLDNLLGFALGRGDLVGAAAVTSGTFDLNDWKSKEKTTEVVLVPPHIDFTMKASVDRVVYGALTATNVRGGVRVKDQRVTLSDLNLQMLRGTVVANGYYETTTPERPTFDVAAKLGTLDIPSAFTSLLTVRTLAPIAQWARGNLSGTIGLKGPLDKAMVPIFTALTGEGSIQTDSVSLQEAPVFTRLADALKYDQLRKPSLQSTRFSYDLNNGRVAVKPFTVTVAGANLTLGGSHGIDQSMNYDVSLAVPRVSDVAKIDATITGTVKNPAVKVNFSGTVASLKEAAKNQVTAKADSAAAEARLRAKVEADRLLAEAQRQADSLRSQAQAIATRIRLEAQARGDSLVAKATNPIARKAAQIAVDRLKREADTQAERIVREADAKGAALVSIAKQKAETVAPPKADSSAGLAGGRPD